MRLIIVVMVAMSCAGQGKGKVSAAPVQCYVEYIPQHNVARYEEKVAKGPDGISYKELEKVEQGQWFTVLGSLGCNFRREKPGMPYGMKGMVEVSSETLAVAKAK